MAELLTSYSQGWITIKDELSYTSEMCKIFNFYLLGTPCYGTSSSGKSMQRRGWTKDVWKNNELRNYLLATAKLQVGVTYQKADRLEKMSVKATAAGLHGNFQTAMDCNRILFYNDGKRVDILSILYYIRCAFEHGRFEIYSNHNGSPTYVLEAITIKRGSGDYTVRPKMVLSEATLIDWAETIMGGSQGFDQRYSDLIRRIRDEIITVIESNATCKKKDISDILPYESSLVFQQLNELKSKGLAFYDNFQKRWRLSESETE